MLLILMLACARGDDARDTADTGVPDTDVPDSGTPDSGDTGGGAPAALADGFAALLTYDVGCGDVWMYAYAPDGTLVLSFRVDGAATAAHDAGGPVTTTYAWPDAGAPPLEVEQGTFLSGLLCNDVIEEAPVVLRRWLPVSGTASLTVEPTGERTDWGEVPSRADLVLTGVSFVPEDDPDAAPVALGDLSISSGVGWMPG